MICRIPSTLPIFACIAASVAMVAPAAPPSGVAVEFVAVFDAKRSWQVSPVHLIALSEAALIQRDAAPLKLAECIALINPETQPAPSKPGGVLLLADGQRLPGEPVETAKASADSLAWNHPWLGRVEVPLRLIQSVSYKSQAAPPPPGASDVVTLVNGDRYEGFVTALGNPVSIEIEQSGSRREVMNLPLERVAAVSMVTPRLPPKGRRIWFGEGTVLEVQSIVVGDDGVVRFTGSKLISGTQVTRLGLNEVAAILFDPSAMLPLVTIAPSRIEGPPSRYLIPKPRLLDALAPLDLSRIEFRGPLVSRYALPAGCVRLAAEAMVPVEDRSWGDCEIVIRSDDAEVFRAHLNGSTPSASINVPLTGRELTIEVTQGAHGPIQDVVVLNRAMLLRRP